MKIEHHGGGAGHIVGLTTVFEIEAKAKCCCTAGFDTATGTKRFSEDHQGLTISVFTNNILPGVSVTTGLGDIIAGDLAGAYAKVIDFAGNGEIDMANFLSGLKPPGTDWKSLLEGEWEGGDPCKNLK